jgi:predicted phage terminase large subunit-like protein
MTSSRGRWKLPRHLDLLNRKLVDLAASKIRRLMVFMPPRHGKSELVSKYFPAWYLGTFPDRNVILTSYEADFAATWGRKARDILEEFGRDLFEVTVRSDSSASHRWDLARHEGGMRTAGAGGAITGKGAHLLIVDDPIKNAEEANSAVHRQKIWEWFQSVAFTRLEPKGSVVLIQTRWHADDLAGRLLKQSLGEGEKWEIINLPAVAEDDDLIGREPGEALWPERYDIDDLNSIRRVIGTYYWQSLYQQKPVDEQGGRIKQDWLRYYGMRGKMINLQDASNKIFHTVNEDELSRFAIMDPAGTSQDVAAERKGRCSWSVIGVFERVRVDNVENLIVRHVWRDRVEIPELIEKAKAIDRQWNPSFIGCEDAGLGLAVRQLLSRERLNVKALRPAGKDKLTRAAELIAMMERGEVFFPRQGAWRETLDSELLHWTGHPDDAADQIDVLAYAANDVGRMYGSSIPWGGQVRTTDRRWGTGALSNPSGPVQLW